MIAWILSKLFSVNTLVQAIGYNQHIVSCQIISDREIEDMAEMFQEMRPGHADGGGDAVIH